MTLISRLMGFARDMLLANLFGVSPATDAFFVAFKIPNFLRRLFAEGAFAQAFVPVLTERRTQDPSSLKPLLNGLTGTLLVILTLLTLVCMVAAPVLILVFAPGFYLSGGEFALASELLRITIPYLLFVTLTALAGAVLNAYNRFSIPAITPVLLNICMMLAAWFWAKQFQPPVIALAWGVFVAGIVQLLFQIPALLRLGLLPIPRWGWQDQTVRRIIKAIPPAVLGGAVVQVNLLVGTLVASFLPSGSVSWLYYSDRLVEFPLGILGVTVASVALPRLSESHAQHNTAGFSKALDWGLRLVVLLGVPATIGLVFLARPMLSTLFQYNAFSSEDVIMAGRSLQAFASGLLGYVLIKVLIPGFTARHDVQTPLRIGWYGVAFNALIAIVLAGPWAHAGVALATSISAYINAAWLLFILLKRGVYQPQPGWFALLMQILFASGLMSSLLYYFVDAAYWLQWSASQRALGLFSSISLAILLYGLALWTAGLRWNALRGEH